jgi:hypothetical protein
VHEVSDGPSYSRRSYSLGDIVIKGLIVGAVALIATVLVVCAIFGVFWLWAAAFQINFVFGAGLVVGTFLFPCLCFAANEIYKDIRRNS